MGESHECVKMNFRFSPIRFACSDPAPNSEPTELKPIQNDVVNYVDITNNGLFVDVNPHRESIQFWSELLSTHRELLMVKF